MDNASTQPWCFHSDSGSTGRCECPEWLWKSLRWIKLIVIHAARNYYAKSAILFIFPLVLGVGLGYFFGQQSVRQKQRQLGGLAKYSTNTNRGDWKYSFYRWMIYLLSVGPSAWYGAGYPTAGSKREIVSIELNQDSEASSKPYETVAVSSLDFRGESVIVKENVAREDLSSDRDMECESGIPRSHLPQHIAVVMDGNRRYGTLRYGKATSGHWDGSRKVLECAKWCLAEHIPVLTVYAFSTENWRRDPQEVATLMSLFVTYCEELRVEAIQRNIRVRVVSTEHDPIPPPVRAGLLRLEHDTRHCAAEGTDGLQMNILLSYGSRGEIVQACQALASECLHGNLALQDISESHLQQRLLTSHVPDPDVVIRTSGEFRLSNFLLWQIAYAELFFLEKNWPELQKADLVEIIRSYAAKRQRRYGK